MNCELCGQPMSKGEEMFKYHGYSGPCPKPPLPKPAKPKIVCLCGSTRFYEYFQRANYEETMAGNIILSVGFYRDYAESIEKHRHIFHGENIGCTPAQKIALDELHKRKIDIADEVFVLNVGGYVGESTRGEIDYALAHGKPIRYLEPTKETTNGREQGMEETPR